MSEIIRNIKNYLKHLTLIAILTTSIPITSAADDLKISASGYGPVRVGMTIKQAEKLLGTQLQAWENRRIDPGCDQLYPKTGHKGVGFMFQNGVVTHASVDTRGIASDLGVSVGDPASKVKELYGSKLEIQPNHYDEEAFYYFAWQQKWSNGIKYDVGSDGIVKTISGGDGTIRLVEGCS